MTMVAICVMKLAVIDMNTIFEKSRRGRILTQKLQANGKQWQDQLRRLDEKRQKLDEVLAAPATTPAARDNAANADRERRGLELELNYLRQRGDADIKAQVSQSQNQIVEEFEPLMREFAKQNSIDAIFTLPGAPLLYVGESVDVTAQALAFYDSKVKL